MISTPDPTIVWIMTSTQQLASFVPAAGTVTKAVTPCGRDGTRFLPATKAIPKEMLPVVDKPAIQYVVEEATRAGLRDVLMVTGRNKTALEDHFDRHWELEQALEAKGDSVRLTSVRKSSVLANIHYVRQGEPLGLAMPFSVLRTTSATTRSPYCSAMT